MASDKDAKIENARKFADAGQYIKAIKAWRELLDDSPNDATVYNTIGDLCLKNKDTAEAIDAYSKAARFYLQEGFHLKAVALYKKILKLDPNRAEIYTLLGDLNVVRGLMSNAIADYLSGGKLYLKIGKPINALTLFRKITKVDPQNMEMCLRVAELCLKEKLTEEAIDEYLRVGREYQRLGRAEEAKKLYEQILKISPGHAEARRRLDTPYEPEAETQEPVASAIEELTVSDAIQSAVALETSAAPEPAPAAPVPSTSPIEMPAELAMAIESPGTPAAVPAEGVELALENLEALPFAEEAAAPKPADLAVEPPAAVEVPVFAEEPTAAPAVEVVQPALMGAPPVVLEPDVDAVFQAFRKGIKEQVGDEEYETHYDLGVAYKEMGLIAEAIEEFQLAARGPTRFVDACTMIAACYADQNLNKSAIAFLERVLADARCAGPGAPYVKYDLAVLYEEEGFVDKATRLYEDIPSIRDVELRLRRLQGGEELPARTPPGTKRPISYL